MSEDAGVLKKLPGSFIMFIPIYFIILQFHFVSCYLQMISLKSYSFIMILNKLGAFCWNIDLVTRMLSEALYNNVEENSALSKSNVLVYLIY